MLVNGGQCLAWHLPQAHLQFRAQVRLVQCLEQAQMALLLYGLHSQRNRRSQRTLFLKEVRCLKADQGCQAGRGCREGWCRQAGCSGLHRKAAVRR